VIFTVCFWIMHYGSCLLMGCFTELSDSSSHPAGLIAGSLAETLKKHPDTIQSYFNYLVMGEENAFTTLNTAFLWDGAYISVPQGVILENPIQLLFVATHREQVYAAQPEILSSQESTANVKLLKCMSVLLKIHI